MTCLYISYYNITLYVRDEDEVGDIYNREQHLGDVDDVHNVDDVHVGDHFEKRFRN